MRTGSRGEAVSLPTALSLGQGVHACFCHRLDHFLPDRSDESSRPKQSGKSTDVLSMRIRKLIATFAIVEATSFGMVAGGVARAQSASTADAEIVALMRQLQLMEQKRQGPCGQRDTQEAFGRLLMCHSWISVSEHRRWK